MASSAQATARDAGRLSVCAGCVCLAATVVADRARRLLITAVKALLNISALSDFHLGPSMVTAPGWG